MDRTLDATEALASRPEPYAILGYCDVGWAYHSWGCKAMEKAVARDPRNWEYHYGWRWRAQRPDSIPARPSAERSSSTARTWCSAPREP